MASHDLRQGDGRSRVHSEVSVYSGEPLSPPPPVYSMFSVCVLLLSCMSVSPKYVSMNALYCF